MFGYFDGLIVIYSDNVYLYFEFIVEEVFCFDVVINVVCEVMNLFKFYVSRKDFVVLDG